MASVDTILLSGKIYSVINLNFSSALSKLIKHNNSLLSPSKGSICASATSKASTSTVVTSIWVPSITNENFNPCLTPNSPSIPTTWPLVSVTNDRVPGYTSEIFCDGSVAAFIVVTAVDGAYFVPLMLMYFSMTNGVVVDVVSTVMVPYSLMSPMGTIIFLAIGVSVSPVAASPSSSPVI